MQVKCAVFIVVSRTQQLTVRQRLPVVMRTFSHWTITTATAKRLTLK